MIFDRKDDEWHVWARRELAAMRWFTLFLAVGIGIPALFWTSMPMWSRISAILPVAILVGAFWYSGRPDAFGSSRRALSTVRSLSSKEFTRRKP